MTGVIEKPRLRTLVVRDLWRVFGFEVWFRDREVYQSEGPDDNAYRSGNAPTERQPIERNES